MNNSVCNHFTVLLADEVLPCFVGTVITVKTVVLEISNNRAVKVADTFAKLVPMVCPIWKSDKSSISSTACTNHLHTTYYTDVQPREYRQ